MVETFSLSPEKISEADSKGRKILKASKQTNKQTNRHLCPLDICWTFTYTIGINRFVVCTLKKSIRNENIKFVAYQSTSVCYISVFLNLFCLAAPLFSYINIWCYPYMLKQVITSVKVITAWRHPLSHGPPVENHCIILKDKISMSLICLRFICKVYESISCKKEVQNTEPFFNQDSQSIQNLDYNYIPLIYTN